MNKCFIFAHFDFDNEIKQYIIDEINLLNKLGDVLFISDCEYINNIDALPKVKYTQINRHSLYDAYSYMSGFKYLISSNTLDNYDNITFVNSSIIFPICDEDSFIKALFEMDNDSNSVYSMCKSGITIQSYWITFKKDIYDIIKNFIDNYVHAETNHVLEWFEYTKNNNHDLDKYLIWYEPRVKEIGKELATKWLYTVINFEEGFSKYLQNKGVKSAALDYCCWPKSRFITKYKKHQLGNKMNKPLVSVILTLYEIKKEYLLECLESLLNQTYDNIEIIAIDDCSPTVDYSDIPSLSSKIHLYRNETNLKMNKSVNKAFSLAKGKYLIRLGSDDIFAKDMIEKEVNVLEKFPEYGAVCCELERFGTVTNVIRRPKEWNLEKILNGNFAGTGYAGGVMFRKDLLKFCSIDETLKMCEDFDFQLQILEHMPIASIHEILYYYRSHDTNLCKTVRRSERLALIDRIIDKHKKILSSKI